jgi:hypothetical protein
VGVYHIVHDRVHDSAICGEKRVSLCSKLFRDCGFTFYSTNLLGFVFAGGALFDVLARIAGVADFSRFENGSIRWRSESVGSGHMSFHAKDCRIRFRGVTLARSKDWAFDVIWEAGMGSTVSMPFPG